MAEALVNNNPQSRRPSPAIHQYSQRIPSPPRIVVPPINMLEGSHLPEFLMIPSPSALELTGFANSEFFSRIDYGSFRFEQDTMMDWKYEQRRVAQKVLPFLYLGPVAVARDAAYLRKEGITMVMGVRNTLLAEARLLNPRAPRDLGLECVNIDVSGNQHLIAGFPKAIEAINLHMSAHCRPQQQSKAEQGQNMSSSKPGKVLVYCESGNERSAAVVAAYIMAMFSLDLIQAIQIVQCQRFCVAFDDPMRQLLQSFDSILRAKRDIAKVRIQRESNSMGAEAKGPETARRSKRPVDEIYENDVEMEETNMKGEPAERRGIAPFADAVALA